MPRLKHIYIDKYPYFVTTTTTGVKVFSDTKLAGILLSCIYYGRKAGWYLLLSFVIMPDHLHIILVPQSKNISQIIKGIKGYSARMINLYSSSYKGNPTDLETYLNGSIAGQECPAYPYRT